MNPLSAYTGVTTASVLAPTAMPSSILFDTLPSSNLLPSDALQSALSYTLPGQGPTVPATGIGGGTGGGIPAVASFFNTDGSIGYTTLPSYRLATATTTASAITSGMTTSATGNNNTASTSQPTAFNANGASITVTKNGLAVLALAVTAFLL